MAILLLVTWLKFDVFCDGMIDLQSHKFCMPRQKTFWESFFLVVRPGIAYPRMRNAGGCVLPVTLVPVHYIIV